MVKKAVSGFEFQGANALGESAAFDGELQSPNVGD
jgi:hypothetical protein